MPVVFAVLGGVRAIAVKVSTTTCSATIAFPDNAYATANAHDPRTPYSDATEDLLPVSAEVCSVTEGDGFASLSPDAVLYDCGSRLPENQSAPNRSRAVADTSNSSRSRRRPATGCEREQQPARIIRTVFGPRTPHVNAVVSRLPNSISGQAAVAGFRLGAVALLLPIGVIHLRLAPTYGLGAAYIGFLFYATFAASLVAAAGIVIGIRGSWIVGLLTAIGAIAGLLTSATVGLPSFTDSFTAPRAMLSLVLEASFVALFALGAALRPRAVLGRPDRHP